MSYYQDGMEAKAEEEKEKDITKESKKIKSYYNINII